ncbi:MAG: hypothetical protein N2482_03280 [Patescibacteria group bacterium]|nr:hypothetical protein [Patescibacteria group bacterium]
MSLNFIQFKETIKKNIFTFNDVLKHFSDKKDIFLRQKIFRYEKKSLIFKIKKGLYCFDKNKVNPIFLANILYQPSYISFQSALFYYGIIIDIPHSYTSATTTTTKKITNIFGTFIYYKIKTDLFFGFDQIEIDGVIIKIAHPEKALLDFFYINKIKDIADLRLDLKKINIERYNQYKKNYPLSIQKIKI